MKIMLTMFYVLVYVILLIKCDWNENITRVRQGIRQTQTIIAVIIYFELISVKWFQFFMKLY